MAANSKATRPASSGKPEGSTLDARLVETALRILAEEGGREALTLRQIARRAGVSHSAPLRHFRSHADLLAEVAARGFALLSEAIEKSGAHLRPGAGPMARLAEAARAYVGTAVAHPGLFALMFRPGDLDITNVSFVRESATAFEHVVRHVRTAQDAGWHAHRETRMLAGATWASVHGLAMLWSQGAFVGAISHAIPPQHGAGQRDPVSEPSLEDAIVTTLELVLGDAPADPHGGKQ